MLELVHQTHLIRAIAAGLGTFLLGLLSRRFLLRRLTEWARRTSWSVDDEVLTSLRRPWLPLFALLGIYIGEKLLAPPHSTGVLVEKTLASIFIVILTFWIASLSVRLLNVSLPARGERSIVVTGVLQRMLWIAMTALGGLILLSTLGVSVTPLLTTLGIGGLAVALGLQETLTNLFAGMSITMARNLRVHDLVKLESGEEGIIEDIGWRTTRVRMLPNNVVLIPNGRLAQSIVTNYDLPDRELAVLIQVGVHYASNLEHVEQVTCEVGKKVMLEVEGGVPDFQPFIRYHSFGESSIDFTAILRARAFTDHFLIKHEFIKRLAARFAKEGIVIPFPIRALNLEQESGGAHAPRIREKAYFGA